jgi:phosphinothricin acetyltransferase
MIEETEKNRQGGSMMIREVTYHDAGRIAEIYGYYVVNTPTSFEIDPPSAEDMEKKIRELKADGYPWLVYEEDGRILGYAYASRFREREAYRYTVEVSVYLDLEVRGKKIGHALMESLLEKVRAMGFYTVVSIVTTPNERSERLFRSLGFEYVGTFRNIGYKLGAWRSVSQFSLKLKDYDESPSMPPRSREE